jgi:hypothetical protein
MDTEFPSGLRAALNTYYDKYGHGALYCADCFQEAHERITDRRELSPVQLVIELSQAHPPRKGAPPVPVDPCSDFCHALDMAGLDLTSLQQAQLFSRALARWQEKAPLGLSVLRLSGVGLSDAALESLVQSLMERSRPSLTDLSLASNGLSDEAVAILVNRYAR